MRVGGERLLVQLLQRSDVVNDPNAAPVRGRDQVVVARVDQQVVHTHGRQTGHELFPLGAAIDRNEDAELGSDKEQVLVLRVLADDVNVTDRQVAYDRSPGRAVIAGDEEVRLQVVVAVVVNREVTGSGVEM